MTKIKIFRPLRQTISWDAQSSLSGSLRTMSVDSNSVTSRLTDVSQSTENEDVGWSSENSNTDDEDTFSDVAGPAPVSNLFFFFFFMYHAKRR